MLERIIKQFGHKRDDNDDGLHEFCPRCEANLTLQKGYDNNLPYWVCKGCGEMLINPSVETESDIVWVCDECRAMLNIQNGFSEKLDEWKCLECGYLNKLDESEVYASEDEFKAESKNPYKGMPDEEVLELSMYQDMESVGDWPNVIRVKHKETGDVYVKKLLMFYDRSIYDHIKAYPVYHMPRIIDLFESDNCLIVIEEYIKGRTVQEILDERIISEKEAIRIAIELCDIIDQLHNLPTPIVHRDIKPANVIITDNDEVYLLDMNVAKWVEPDKNYDTHFLGTQDYAAPEQVGYGLSASSAKSDIYALGIMQNVMVTGRLPKQERAKGDLWPVIQKCISLKAEERYTAKELKKALYELARS